MKTGSMILVVDDDDAVRASLRLLLESRGYRVCEAPDGGEALIERRKNNPLLAIVDLDMPKMNGLEFTRRVKGEDPHLPIIMVTGYARFYSPDDILAAGVDAFLQKPIDIPRLLSIIEHL
jgi:CheY-like chemotaxis protein